LILSSDVDGSFQEQNVSDVDITNLSMEVVYPFKNPSTNSVTTFLSVDKLYELPSLTIALPFKCFPQKTRVALGNDKFIALTAANSSSDGKSPDLVTKLYELEQNQTRDVRGALFDKGKYVLSKQATYSSSSTFASPALVRP
jgi:hypothetical protein